jgi:prepilin-type N-terminal cleavage/methylation domain-containing protein
MRALAHERGFTLVELIAGITILAILAAVALPRVVAASPFQQRGYANVVTASLRQARAMAIASDCAVRFTINRAGFSVAQRNAAGGHCASAGGFNLVMFTGEPPSGVTPLANRTITFNAGTGLLTGATTTVTFGAHVITIDASGVVTGP